MEDAKIIDSRYNGSEDLDMENDLVQNDSSLDDIDDLSEEYDCDDAEIDENSNEDKSSSSLKTKVWRNDERALQSDEELELSPGCYDMLHRISLDWSCLSFDILKDDLGGCRVNFPIECYVVSGTQPGTIKGMDSLIHVMRWSNITKNFGEIDDDLLEDEEESIFKISSIKHKGIVNRIKSCPQTSRLVCSMSDTNDVYIWDIENQLNDIKSDKKQQNNPYKSKPLFTCKLHSNEGYSVGWSYITTGLLSSGDCDGTLICYQPVEGGWKDSQILYLATSIEDIKWSYTDKNMLLSACCDGTVKLIDIRDKKVSSEINVTDTDVNSISINPIDTNLVLTGSEDGSVKIYDLRYTNSYLSNLKWHRKAITSVDWHPLDSSVCAVGSRDDSVTIWDVSIESENCENQSNLPQQMMFLHMGQTEITELMFHRNIPGVIITTALDGFNIFKTVNVD